LISALAILTKLQYQEERQHQRKSEREKAASADDSFYDLLVGPAVVLYTYIRPCVAKIKAPLVRWLM
jgi:hypothetical protein